MEVNVMIHIAVPQWVNFIVGTPVLIAIALAINYLSAIWLSPIAKKNDLKQSTSSIFSALTFFSVLSAAFGALSAWWGTSTIGALSILLLFATLGALMMSLPQTLYVVAATITIPTFFIGHVAVEENTFIAFLLTIAGTASVLLLGMFVTMLAMFEKKQDA